jgi:hypothetical protein
MLSTFFYALMTNRGFLMNWQKSNPTSLESVFEQPNINWSFDPKEMKALYNTKTLGHHSVNTLNFNWERIRSAMFPQGPSQDFNELWTAPVSRYSSRVDGRRRPNSVSLSSMWKSNRIEATSSERLVIPHGTAINSRTWD